MNGTCTGEYGIGFGKLSFLHGERRRSGGNQSIKGAPDPRSLFN